MSVNIEIKPNKIFFVFLDYKSLFDYGTHIKYHMIWYFYHYGRIRVFTTNNIWWVGDEKHITHNTWLEKDFSI